MKTFIHSKSLKGFSTIEILITFAVGIVFLTAAMLVAFSDPTLARSISLDSGQAATLDIALDSTALATSTNSLSSTTAKLLKNWNASISSITQTGTNPYAITPTIVDIAPCFKTISNETGWSRSFGNRSHTMTFGTGLANLNIARALGRGACDPVPSSSVWDSPQKYPSGITLSSVNANDIAIIFDQGKRIVVLAATPSGSGSGVAAFEDIYSYDLTDPSNPSLVLGKLNTGVGINAIATNGQYVFALQNSATNQLQVIRMFDTSLNPSNPAYYTPKVVATTTLQNVGGANPEGRSIAYYNNRLYIGTWNNNVPPNSPEFLIYNVGTPSSPSFQGSFNLGHSVNSIVIKDSYAYLATTDNVGELTILNVSNPASISVAGRYDLPASTNDAEEVAILGNEAFLGLNRSPSNSEFLIINITNPSSPTLVAGRNLNLKNNTKVSGIDVHDNFAFIGTDDSTAEFRVLDIENPLSPVTLPCSPYSYSAAVSAVQYSDGYVFVTNRVNNALRVIYDTNGTSC